MVRNVASGAVPDDKANQVHQGYTNRYQQTDLLGGPSSLFALLLLLSAHAALWTLVPFLRNHNLPLDVIEHLAWGREWQLGYHKHPPMVSWLLESTVSVFGRHDVAIYALSQACIALSFILTWRLARSMLAPFPALAATIIGVGVIYHGFTSPEFNVNVVSLPFWSLAIWLAHKLYASPPSGWSVGYWMLLGFAAAGAVLAKYTGAILVLCIFILFVTPPAWIWWRTRGPYLAIYVFVMALLPHGIWLLTNDFPTFTYALARGDGAPDGMAGHLLAPVGFIASQLPAILPAAVIVAIGWPWQLRRFAETDRHDFVLLVLGIGPLATLLIIALIFSLELKSMWGTTLFLLFGTMSVRWLRPARDVPSAKRLVAGSLVVLVLGPLAYVGEPAIANTLLDRPKRTQFPGIELSRVVEQAWHTRYDSPLPFVVGDEWLAGNVSYYADDRPSAFINADETQAPWANLQSLAQSGGVVLWMSDKHGRQPMPLTESRFSALTDSQHLVEQAPIILPWATSSQLPQVTVNWAIIPPQEAVSGSAGLVPVATRVHLRLQEWNETIDLH